MRQTYSQNLQVHSINCGRKVLPETLRGGRALMTPIRWKYAARRAPGSWKFSSQKGHIPQQGFWAGPLAQLCVVSLVAKRASSCRSASHSPVPLSRDPSEVIRVQLSDWEGCLQTERPVDGLV